jgi:imidazole glycerol-phosphate synthase subunit HisH
MKTKIVIIDYGIGNIYSVKNALHFLGYKNVVISESHDVIHGADALILPGVGAFEECINNLKSRNLHEVLNREVLEAKKPILGICVGMQLMADLSEENGIHTGLGWIPGQVKRLDVPEKYIVPHVGWNNVKFNNAEPLFKKSESEINFYFDHSYSFCCDEEYISAYCDYGTKVTAAVQKENIFGVQFHPEKSQISGLKLFRNFFNYVKGA